MKSIRGSHSQPHKWSRLLYYILLLEGVGFISSLLSGDIKKVYNSLNKPLLAPPSWLFGVVWPILFALMGIALYLIRQAQQRFASPATQTFILQIVLNFFWPILFFRLQTRWLSMILLVLLFFAVLATTRRFSSIRKAAGYLMWPYIFWLLFAAYLNLGFAVLQ